MKTIVKSVLVHSCELVPTVQPEKSLSVDKVYVLLDQDPDFKKSRIIPLDSGRQYFALKTKCSCRQMISYAESEEMLAVGGAKAIWHLNTKRKYMELHEEVKKNTDSAGVTTVYLLNSIWKAQQVQVPRVDMISAPDIERAYIDDNWNFIRLIEETHEMFMRNRAELIVPFREDLMGEWPLPGRDKNGDPTPGRLLFPFPQEERTPGGIGDKDRQAILQNLEKLKTYTKGKLKDNKTPLHPDPELRGPN